MFLYTLLTKMRHILGTLKQKVLDNNQNIKKRYLKNSYF